MSGKAFALRNPHKSAELVYLPERRNGSQAHSSNEYPVNKIYVR
jgi:hypothetical protein